MFNMVKDKQEKSINETSIIEASKVDQKAKEITLQFSEATLSHEFLPHQVLKQNIENNPRFLKSSNLHKRT